MADGKFDKKKKPANRINELLEKPVKLENTASPVSKPEMDAPGAVITLELNYEGRDLKLSVHESRSGEESTIRHYENLPFAADKVEQRCKVLVETLNKANRRGRVTRPTLDRLREIGQLMYDELLSLNVKEKLRKTQARTLILSIDDSLVHIPWELLYDGKQFFCLQFSMGRLVKTRQTPARSNGRRLSTPLELMILADPTGDLKNAYTEGTQIRDYLDQRPDLVNATLRTDYVSVEALKAKLRNFDIIHFAGHSDYNPLKPEDGGWRLRDASLTTQEIVQMAGSAAMPKMVFANACQSARTEQWLLNDTFEREIFGLANAFLLAGVKHYIGTFWEILDEPGGHFAIAFYKHLFSGISVGESILKARKALIELYGEETIIWASYVFYGDPTFNYMSQIRMQTSDIQQDEPMEHLKPAAQDRTREEVIDFVSGQTNKFGSKWWSMAAAAILLVIIWQWGVPWYRHRGFVDQERRAIAHYAAGEYDRAGRMCESLRKDAPHRPMSSIILGNILLSDGKLDDAHKYFKTAIEVSDDTDMAKAEAWLGLGRVASIRRRPQDALQYYRQAADIDPKNVHAVRSQAVLMEQQGRYEDALRAYDQAVSLAPDDTSLHVAVNQIRDHLDFQKDEAKQLRIDRLVKEILDDHPASPVVPAVEAWTSKPLTVWLLDFESSGFSLQEGQERLVHGLITDQMIKQTRVQVVERAILDKLLQELRLGTSRLSEHQTALSVGRLMAARVVLFGRMQYTQQQVQVALRFIECETGLVRASVIEMFEKTATPLDIAEKLSSNIIDRLRKIYPIRATITTVRDGDAHIDAGHRQGVHPGQIFKGQNTDVTIRITSVESQKSKAEVITGRKSIHPGLKLEEQSPPSP